MSMRCAVLAITITVLSASTAAGTGGVDAPEPVNVIAESGLDVGPCPDTGTLSYPPTPYKGSAYFLRRADATLAAQHERLTKQRAAWLHRLDGPSGTNRLFTAANGDRAIVFWSCKAGDCGANVAYGAYGMQSAGYMLQVHEGGAAQSIGSASPTLAAAIACARAHDDRARGHAAEQLKKQTGK
jgi:hypothetical protein